MDGNTNTAVEETLRSVGGVEAAPASCSTDKVATTTVTTTIPTPLSPPSPPTTPKPSPSTSMSSSLRATTTTTTSTPTRGPFSAPRTMPLITVSPPSTAMTVLQSKTAQEAIANFRPVTPREVIYGIAPHVFDERKRRRSVKRQSSRGYSNFYYRNHGAYGDKRRSSSPLVRATVISWDDTSIYLEQSQQHPQHLPISSRPSRDSVHLDSASTSSVSTKNHDKPRKTKWKPLRMDIIKSIIVKWKPRS